MKHFFVKQLYFGFVFAGSLAFAGFDIANHYYASAGWMIGMAIWFLLDLIKTYKDN